MTLGRTYLFKPLNEWIIPLRYAVRDQAGEVVAVMTTGISLDGENNPWKIDGLPESVYINIIKDANAAGEYYPQFIHPLIMYGRDKEQTYDDPASQELVEHVVEHIEAAAGVDLDAFTQSGKAVYFNLKMPGVGQVYGTQGYNSDLKLFTAVRRSLLSMRDEFVAVFIWYFIVFTLFNVMLVVFRYINNLQREAKQQLEFQANHDQLTELPNRYYLKKKFPEWRKRWGNAYALLYLDLDNFKLINDHYGHSVGDWALVELAKRLKESCSEETMLVRHGGDEFIMLMPFSDKSVLQHEIQRITYRLKEVIHVNALEFALSGSVGVGVACPEEHENSLEGVLIKADLAMYEAKKVRNSYVFFTEEMQQLSDERAVIEEALHGALNNRQLFMVYQPQIDAESGCVVGVEALIRWQHPVLGFVPPDKFIAVAEASGQINPIGDFVIDTALKEIATIQAGFDPIRLSINVSVQQLVNEGFRARLKEKAAEYDINPTNLVIEITESLFIEDFEQIESLLVLIRNDGFGISLDDFGTGYSSLSVLRSLPINEVKVDQSFVRHILTDEHDRALIQSIIGIGQSLKIPTLAEGVEELEHARSLRGFGCNLFQGYYFARPMDIDALKEYLTAFKAYEL
ncbi:putative bifunctional diguanylate cyclase/phosphodiesterase [Candidatus Reidiella endopervernicosa]|uniref:EAL domain-containing protein n=1 Tax=Candidatus Reidiella endopervernicosa TaxID=2738883 RepID=A0A6N0HRK9_9GAMM|nr:EAL domain-containing protein [Candidatus Reidiella endopervernicosa]QKQ25072.1 EAL domain-containing protein [Candidatus Reidiella endopervernicosa]